MHFLPMKKVKKNEFIWEYKYRPQTVDDVIMSDEYHEIVNSWMKSGEASNIIFSSIAGGTGKTSLVNALLNDLSYEYLWVNASMTGINDIRGKIQSFASTVSFDDNHKIVVFDEVDHITHASQPALRGFLDTYGTNTRFFFTCNYANMIIEPLMTRLVHLNFDKMLEENKKELMAKQVQRLAWILHSENIEYDIKDVMKIVKTFYPSFREAVLTAQKFSVSGAFVVNDDHLTVKSTFNKIFRSLKKTNFSEMRSLVLEIVSPSSFYDFLWANLEEYIEDKSRPSAIMILAKYQEMDSRVKNKNLNLAACLTEMMGSKINFK